MIFYKFRTVCALATATSMTGLFFSAAVRADTPPAKPAPKAPAKVVSKTPPARPASGLVGINRQLLYSNSSTFSQSRRVMRTERSNVLRSGTASLWDSDRSEEARRLQRRAEQRSRALQQRLRLQKQYRDEARVKASSR